MEHIFWFQGLSSHPDITNKLVMGCEGQIVVLEKDWVHWYATGCHSVNITDYKYSKGEREE